MVKPTIVNLIAGLLIGLIIGGGVAYVFTAGGVVGGAAQGLPSEIPIGALLPLTGDLSGFGAKWKNALEMAETDINNYVSTLGLNVKFKILVEDTKTSEEGALQALQSLVAKGVKVVLGPAASNEVSAIKSYADSNKIVVISGSSTAPSLAIPGDYIFRLVTTDLFQAKAVARMIWSKGVKKVAVIYRGDDWGDGLFNGFKSTFEDLGGTVDSVRYDPKALEFSSEVASLADKVSALGVSPETAVLLISFEEDGISILNAAKDYSVLMSVEWFGTDGTAFSTKIASQVGDVAVSVGGLPSTIFAPTSSPVQQSFFERYKDTYGVEPDSYTHNMYDAAWLAAMTILQVGKYDGEAIAKALPEVAARFFGVSGWLNLDENGDRAFGDYSIAAIVFENGEYVCKVVGVYRSTTDTVEWF